MFRKQVNYCALQKQIFNSQQLYENMLSDDELYTIDTCTVQIYIKAGKRYFCDMQIEDFFEFVLSGHPPYPLEA